MTQKIVAETIRSGMIIRTATDARFDVVRVTLRYGVVKVYNHRGEHRAIDAYGTVTLLGHFNPES